MKKKRIQIHLLRRYNLATIGGARRPATLTLLSPFFPLVIKRDYRGCSSGSREREFSLFCTYDGEEDGEKKWGLLFIVFESCVIEINRDIN